MYRGCAKRAVFAFTSLFSSAHHRNASEITLFKSHLFVNRSLCLSWWTLHLLSCLLILRYPLIIDPSGQATEFIMNEYKDRKITRTSFLDDAFRKNLESALRFGNPLLVQVCVYVWICHSGCGPSIYSWCKLNLNDTAQPLMVYELC